MSYDRREDEMLTMADRLEIEDLYRSYCWAADTGDAEAWIRTFTPDGVFDVNGDVVAGERQLRAWVEARVAFRETEDTVGQHWVTNIQVDGDTHTAKARCYYMRTVMVRSGEPRDARIAAAGWSVDDLRKVGGRWAFARRVLSKHVPWRTQDGRSGSR